MATPSETRVRMARIRYEASIWPMENGDFVASAWPLDIASQGSSVDHALTMLQEAVSAVPEVEYEQGTSIPTSKRQVIASWPASGPRPM